jgi:hypothetical protein
MKLYHGSNVDIQKIDLEKSKPNKDFGKAFYLSENYQQAMEMAQFKAEFTDTEPVVSVFEFDKGLMTDLRCKCFEGYTEEWAHFVYDHRTEPQGKTLHDYDIVYGPIADDGVTFQLRRYVGGVISLARLVEELKYAKGITFQYFFGTERALQQLKRL